MTELLVKNGLDINEKYGDLLPIEYAIKYADPEVIKVMIELGANISELSLIKKQAFTLDGNNDLLSQAIKFRNKDVFDFLDITGHNHSLIDYLSNSNTYLNQ